LTPIARIHIDKLIHNFNYINSHINNSRILAVVKANAYGHGAIKISRTLEELGADGLCVATADELSELRMGGINIPILHLGVLNQKIINLYQSKNNVCTINSIDDIDMINNALIKRDKKINCYLKVDTGMGRLGVNYKQASDVIQLIKDNNKIKLAGVYSHFSSSDEENKFTDIQLKRFNDVVYLANSLISDNMNYHISNSAGLLKNDSSFFDLVRAGISLYGINNTNIDHDLMPVMELKAPVILIKNIKKGDSVGYNRKFIASQDTKIGYLQIGYEDGYPINMINSNLVFYKDKLLNVVGKISMDLTAVNFTDIDVKIGDWVTLFGNENNKLEYVCSKVGTNPYSILTGIGNRVVREYVND